VFVVLLSTVVLSTVVFGGAVPLGETSLSTGIVESVLSELELFPDPLAVDMVLLSAIVFGGTVPLGETSLFAGIVEFVVVTTDLGFPESLAEEVVFLSFENLGGEIILDSVDVSIERALPPELERLFIMASRRSDMAFGSLTATLCGNFIFLQGLTSLDAVIDSATLFFLISCC